MVSCSNSNSEASSSYPSQPSIPWDGETMDQPDPNAQLSAEYNGAQCAISFAKEPTIKVDSGYVQNGLNYDFYDQLMEKEKFHFIIFDGPSAISIESSVKIQKVLVCNVFKLTKNGNNYERTKLNCNGNLKESVLEVEVDHYMDGIYVEASFLYLTAENKGYIYHVAALTLFETRS